MSDNKGLPDLSSLLGKGDSQLDAIIKADEADKARENALFEEEERKKKRKKYALFGVGGVAVLALATGLFATSPFGGSQLWGDLDGRNTVAGSENNGEGSEGAQGAGSSTDDSSSTAENGAPKGLNISAEDSTLQRGEEAFWVESGRRYPISLAEWQLKSYDDSSQNSTVVNNSIFVTPGIATGLNNLPFREAGYTDNVDELTLPDGSLNPMYTYWTAEGFNEKVGVALTRFVNPEFGGWQAYQYPNAAPYLNDPAYLKAAFADIFDPEYVTSMEGEPTRSWIPIYADWESNDYGMGDKLLKDGPRWMGVLDSVETNFVYDDATDSYSADVTAHISYFAWGQDQSKLTKKGVITLDVEKGPVENRYLIRNAKLEITE